MIPSREDVAWAAGLFEGEGNISGYAKARRGFRLALWMTDADVVKRFSDIVQVGSFGGPYNYPSAPNSKPLYRWRTGSFEHGQYVLAMLWPYLGIRRKQRAREVLCNYANFKLQRYPTSAEKSAKSLSLRPPPVDP